MKLRKGFTIIELVITIAVIAILAAIIVPSVSNVFYDSCVSADISLVRNLNTALGVDGGTYNTLSSAVAAVGECGYTKTSIITQADGNAILFDKDNGVFCYFNSESDSIEYYPSLSSVTTNESNCVIVNSDESIDNHAFVPDESSSSSGDASSSSAASSSSEESSNASNKVAVIDNTEYDTLGAALSAASDNCTIKLKSDTTIDYIGVTEHSLTLDLNGYTLTVTGKITDNDEKCGIFITKDTTIENGNIHFNFSDEMLNENKQILAFGFYINGTAGCNINEVVVSSKTPTDTNSAVCGIFHNSTGNVTITESTFNIGNYIASNSYLDGTLLRGYGIYQMGTPGLLTVKDSTIYCGTITYQSDSTSSISNGLPAFTGIHCINVKLDNSTVKGGNAKTNIDNTVVGIFGYGIETDENLLSLQIKNNSVIKGGKVASNGNAIYIKKGNTSGDNKLIIDSSSLYSYAGRVIYACEDSYIKFIGSSVSYGQGGSSIDFLKIIIEGDGTVDYESIT